MSDEEKIDLEYRWSGAKFAIGWAKLVQDKALWVWIAFTFIGTGILNRDNNGTVAIIVTGGWIAVTVIYLLGNSFKRGFEQFLKNSKADVNVAVGRKA